MLSFMFLTLTQGTAHHAHTQWGFPTSASPLGQASALNLDFVQQSTMPGKKILSLGATV